MAECLASMSAAASDSTRRTVCRSKHRLAAWHLLLFIAAAASTSAAVPAGTESGSNRRLKMSNMASKPLVMKTTTAEPVSLAAEAGVPEATTAVQDSQYLEDSAVYEYFYDDYYYQYHGDLNDDVDEYIEEYLAALEATGAAKFCPFVLRGSVVFVSYKH